jgi:hypothetical protein
LIPSVFLSLIPRRAPAFQSVTEDDGDEDKDELDVDLVAKISDLLDGCGSDSLDRLTPEQK